MGKVSLTTQNLELKQLLIIVLVISFVLLVTQWIVWVVNISKSVIFIAHVWKLILKIKNKPALNM